MDTGNVFMPSTVSVSGMCSHAYASMRSDIILCVFMLCMHVRTVTIHRMVLFGFVFQYIKCLLTLLLH